MNNKRASIVLLTLAVTVAAAAQQPTAPALPKPLHFGSWGVDLAGMDRTTNPGDDFDRYVNGTWSTQTDIPADQSSAGVGYDVFNLSQEQIRAIIEHAPTTTQLGAMYQSFMNEAAVEKLDDKPLQADLQVVAAIQDRDAFTAFMGQTNGRFGSTRGRAGRHA